jgi:predicted regulator of Ras-like GTPase activity (Roadblock/LC7/MglB family)
VKRLAEALEGVRARVGGVRVALLVGLDGVVVARSSESAPIADELLAASFADLLRRADASARDSDLGPADELTLGAPHARVVVRKLSAEYALVVLLEPDALVGRARHELRLAAERIAPEIAA